MFNVDIKQVSIVPQDQNRSRERHPQLSQFPIHTQSYSCSITRRDSNNHQIIIYQ